MTIYCRHHHRFYLHHFCANFCTNFCISIAHRVTSLRKYLPRQLPAISRRWLVALIGVTVGTLLSGCGSLLPKAPVQPTLYMLDALPLPLPQPPGTNAAAAINQPGNTAPTLTVNTPIAAAGFGSTHIVYQRQAHELEHFALNQWVDTPVQMLTPLMVRAIEQHGGFRAVVRGSTAAVSELRLDTELIRLQQEFNTTPSRVRLTLRAVLVNTTSRRVLASREFDASVATSSDDPVGGVAAANQAVQRALGELAAFCADSASGAASVSAAAPVLR